MKKQRQHKTNQKPEAKKIQHKAVLKSSEISHNPNASGKIKIWLGFIIAIIAFLLYCNTLTHQYALDDYASITNNKLVQNGIKSVPVILSTSYWYGMDNSKDAFYSSLYRPLSIVMFAIEWQLAPNKPFLGHLINVLLYALTGFLVFIFIRRLFPRQNIVFAFIVSLLWILHPLHTEVAANIKSRDEILCMLFSILALNEALKFSIKSMWQHLLLMTAYFGIALFSKETAICLIFIIPLTLLFSSVGSIKKFVIAMLPIALCTVLFFIARSAAIGNEVSKITIAVNDNSMAGSSSLSERYGTAIFVLGYYLLKFVAPISLASDYSFDQIQLVGFSNPLVLISLVVYISMIVYVIIYFKKKDPVTYAVLFFFFSIGIVSNIFFLSGSTMAERFMYMPSLGLCMGVTWIFFRIFKVQTTQNLFKQGLNKLLHSKILVGILLCPIIFFSIKTIARNADWKNNITLFTADLKTVPRNVKMKYYYAIEVLEQLKNGKLCMEKQQEYLKNAIAELNAGLKIDPNYYLLYGTKADVYNYEQDYRQAITNFRKAISINNKYTHAFINLGDLYFSMQKYDSAIYFLNTALALDPQSSITLNSMAGASYSLNKYDDAVKYLQKAILIDPGYAEAYKNLGTVYSTMKKYDDAIIYYKKAMQMEPQNAAVNYYLGSVYAAKGDTANADFYKRKAKTMDPSIH